MKEFWRDIGAILNLLGSIASITGISLLWLTGNQTFRWENILEVAVVVSFIMGMVAFGIMVLRFGYNKWAYQWDWLGLASYFLMGVPTLFFLGLFLFFGLNRFVIWMFKLL